MFKQWKGFLSGVVFTLAIAALTVSVFAAATGTSISVYFDGIKVLLNGKAIETKDVNGNDAEPFNYNGSIYVPVRAVAEAFGKTVEWDADSKSVMIYETEYEAEIDKFWNSLLPVRESYALGLSDDVMDKADYYIEKYGVDVLFQGLKSSHVGSQFYCMNRLVEYYNDEAVRARAIAEITPFLSSTDDTLKQGAEFAVSVLGKKFDSPYIVHGAGGVKIFALLNDYIDYGSHNELWIVRDDKLSKLYSFTGLSHYIDTTEPIALSPDKDKIAVQTCSRRSSSINIIDINTGEVSSEIMVLAIEKIAADNPGYDNTYPDGRYCWCGGLKWLDNDTVEFEASLAYDFMDIIENVTVTYSVSDNSLEYISR